MRVHRRALLAPAVAVMVLAAASPALADDPTPTPTETIATTPPDQPEESDLAEGAPETDAPAPSDSMNYPNMPDGRGCDQGWYYHPTSKTKDYHKGVGVEQANYNGTSRTAKSAFTSEVTGTVGVAYTGELNVKGTVAVAEISSKFGVTVSASLTAKIGNTVTVDTPSHKTTYARYGVFRLKSYGYSQYVYVNCGKGSKKNVTIYTPHRVGWAIWEN
ncbi:hypothetical protein [Streptomyces sp. SID4982]|uniref:hypothetical protein n=1 Tax=Streptomyces sp. SID4982 TaxID=2690291 RepID=UPI0013683A76|nr:hypothetical protein [Streptomyces sp. SID4982]MYS13703.1 hypothetical protein [Streptomyces sp. SID4982]